MAHKRKILILLTIMMTFIGCEALKTAKPIIPIKEYEKMIAGRLDADYVGTARCLAACHSHDALRKDFEASTMGAQLSKKSGMPIVDCESCHGPGSLAIADITPEKIEKDKKEGKETACNYDALIDYKKLPAQALSLICLKCHTANAQFNLHNWNASEHSLNDVSCSDCHKVHAGVDLKVKPRETVGMCVKCHEDIQAEFMLFSHHPLHEKKVFCTDCHEPHGTTNFKSLKQPTTKRTCTQCHAEKEGPFVFEHADNTEECSSCHSPHGSVNTHLLNVRVPFLCLQCHEGHRTSTTSGSKPEFYANCTSCHNTIHGTDIPSRSGTGRFTR